MKVITTIVKHADQISNQDYLRNYDPAATEDGCVKVLGYHKKGDGGGGEFYWDETDNTSKDNGGTIFVSSKNSSGRWKRLFDEGYVNVKWFGAIGDAKTDDTKAIQAAINYLNPIDKIVVKFDNSQKSGGVVFLPGGIYMTTDTLWVGNSVTLRGVSSASHESNRFGPSTGTVIRGMFNENKFIIQTLSLYKSGQRVKWNETLSWTPFDDRTLGITTGTTIENLILSGIKAFGGIRLCAAVCCKIRNCGIFDSNVGVVIDDGISIKISDCQFSVRTIAISAGPHANGLALENLYIEGDPQVRFHDLGIQTPGWAAFSGTRKGLGYNDQKSTTAIFLNGVFTTVLSNLIIQGYDLGIILKDTQATADALYFETIVDTCIPLIGNTQFVIGNILYAGVGSVYGINDDSVRLVSLDSPNRYGSCKSYYKDFNNQPQSTSASAHNILTRYDIQLGHQK